MREALDGGGNITPAPTVVISKGKAKQVLEIQATITVNASASLPSVYLGFVVNGVWVTPGFPDSQCNPAGGYRCAITATYWLDIDTAEAANPGLFVGQPLRRPESSTRPARSVFERTGASSGSHVGPACRPVAGPTQYAAPAPPGPSSLRVGRT